MNVWDLIILIVNTVFTLSARRRIKTEATRIRRHMTTLSAFMQKAGSNE